MLEEFNVYSGDSVHIEQIRKVFCTPLTLIWLNTDTYCWRMSFCGVSCQTLSKFRIRFVRSWDSLRFLLIRPQTCSTGDRSCDTGEISVKQARIQSVAVIAVSDQALFAEMLVQGTMKGRATQRSAE